LTKAYYLCGSKFVVSAYVPVDDHWSHTYILLIAPIGQAFLTLKSRGDANMVIYIISQAAAKQGVQRPLIADNSIRGTLVIYYLILVKGSALAMGTQIDSCSKEKVCLESVFLPDFAHG